MSVEQLDWLKSEMARVAPESAAPLFSQITEPAQLLFAEYFDTVVRRQPFHENLLLLGDACHATSPLLGNGVNLALFDAMSLAASLEAVIDPHHLPRALVDYADARRAHVRFYSLTSRALTPLFQSHNTVLGGARDLFMGSLTRIPPFPYLMTSTLAGIRRGVMRSFSIDDLVQAYA